MSAMATHGRPAARVLAAWLAVWLTAACANPAMLRDRPLEDGKAMPFRASSAAVYPIAVAAVREAGLRIEHQYHVSADTWMILASSIASPTEVTAIVRVVVEGTDENECVVHVLSKRTIPTEITFSDFYADRIFGYLVARLVQTPGD
ncbi:MAG: hypothetical protein ACE5HQ_09140 [Gemmatimonadota bacterium]